MSLHNMNHCVIEWYQELVFVDCLEYMHVVDVLLCKANLEAN